MEEIIDLENQIRAAMPRARDEAPIEIVTEAIALMQSKSGVGTRLERLRNIVEALKPYVEAIPTHPVA